MSLINPCTPIRSLFKNNDIVNFDDFKNRFYNEFEAVDEARTESDKFNNEYLKPTEYYNYLYLDVSKLPDPKKIKFSEFANAIFYIGKGRDSRCFHHLWETLASNEDQILSKKKLIKIDECLKKSGLIIVQDHFTIKENECLSSKASLIRAIGIENLTNEKRGMIFGWVNKFESKFSLKTQLFVRDGWSRLFDFHTNKIETSDYEIITKEINICGKDYVKAYTHNFLHH